MTAGFAFVQDFFWAAIFLAPSCVLIWIGAVVHLLGRWNKYTVPVEAEVTRFDTVSVSRGCAYRVYYMFYYDGRTLELPDVSTQNRRPVIGQQRIVRIDPDTKQDIFDQGMYWKQAWAPLLVLLFLTVAAFTGLTE